MKTYIKYQKVFLFILCLVPLQGFTQDLDTKVSLTAEGQSLPEILNDIQDRYKVRFAYINNELPAGTINLKVKDKPLSGVLEHLLDGSEAGFVFQNGIIIIKAGLPRKQSEGETKISGDAGKNDKSVPKKNRQNQSENKAILTISREEIKKEIRELVEIPDYKTSEGIEETSGEGSDKVEDNNGSQEIAYKYSYEVFEYEILNNKDSLPDIVWEGQDSIRNTEEVRTVSRSSFFNAGLVPPLSIYGVNSDEAVFNLGLYLISGHSKGVRGAEISLVGNRTESFMHGLQLSSVYNLVNGKVSGSQLSLVVNIAGEEVRGFQLSGVVNRTADLQGLQLGLLNFSVTASGLQLGFLNQAKSVHGVQVSGIGLAGKVRGVQFSAINIARKVNGGQVGLINIADSISGIPLGVISIVKYNAYKDVEVFASDDFHVNAAFKLGVPLLHTIFALGAQTSSGRRWGIGGGFGSEWTISRRLRLNTDLMTYYVMETPYSAFPEGVFGSGLNLLNKFRLPLTWKTEGRMAVFAGPVLNVMVSQYGLEEGAPGSMIVRNVLFNNTSEKTSVKIWAGFNAGLRFHLGK
ncbi:hypothetical protein RCC89_07345 [Cytophagaceae bacterium ABcell3]|nr:hypothetical protein RCC89_07345 [Cytophagaceae bacterium ABcell3]